MRNFATTELHVYSIQERSWNAEEGSCDCVDYTVFLISVPQPQAVHEQYNTNTHTMYDSMCFVSCEWPNKQPLFDITECIHCMKVTENSGITETSV